MRTYQNYICFLSDLMVIEIPYVVYHSKGSYYDITGSKVKPFNLRPTAKSTTVPNENTIYVDLDKLDENLEIYIVSAHEIRHCAQYQCLDDVGMADIATPEMIKQWRTELKDYSGSNVKNYENQSIEMDANAFAWFIGRTVFNIEIHLNNGDKALFEKYKKYISNLFSIEEVRESMQFAGFDVCKHQA